MDIPKHPKVITLDGPVGMVFEPPGVIYQQGPTASSWHRHCRAEPGHWGSAKYHCSRPAGL